jgi:F-type H+-transporting ATPase subunit gamma
MPNLRDIRKRIESTISISKITMTMEKIATVRMTRMMQRMESSKAYNAMLLDMVEELFFAALKEDNSQGLCILGGRKNVRNAGVVFIASSQGLCAGFNVALYHELEKLEQRLKNAPHPALSEKEGGHVKGEGKSQDGHTSKIKLRYYAIGKKAVQFLDRRRLPMEYSLDKVTDRFTYEEIESLSNLLVQDINLGKIDDIYLVYTHYVASATYRVVAEPMSPCKKFAKKIQEHKIPNVKPIICHPNLEELMRAFLPEIITNRIYKALLESMVCEQIARRMAMKQATDAADDKVEELRIMYHTMRQAKITKEVNEMMGTVLALQRE